MKNQAITIGLVSKKTGVKIETIRYYEKIGLMPHAYRTEGRHRLYTSNQVSRLKFIKRSRELGFTLNDIRTLIGLEDKPPSCAEVHTITVHHLKEVRNKIIDLKRLEKTLSTVAMKCDQSDAPECPIIETLSVG